MAQDDSIAQFLEQCVTNLEFSPAEILESRDYVCVALSGRLRSATQYLSSAAWERLEKLSQTVLAISFVNIDKPSEGKLASEAKDLVSFLEQVASKGKKIALVKCPSELRSFLEQNTKVPIEFIENLATIQRRRNLNQTDFSRELGIFIEAIETVFQKQFKTTPKIKDPGKAIQRPAGIQIQSEVLGTIDISGTHLIGLLVVAMSDAVVSKLCEEALGVSLSQDDPDFPQIVGETCNLVLGYAKERLNKEGYGIIQAVPQCFRHQQEKGNGSSLYIHRPSSLMEFESSKGKFQVYLALERLKA